MNQTEFTYYIPKNDFQQITLEKFIPFYDGLSPSGRVRLFSNDIPPSISSIISNPDYTKPLMSRDVYPKK